jgi:hypothetical protein
MLVLVAGLTTAGRAWGATGPSRAAVEAFAKSRYGGGVAEVKIKAGHVVVEARMRDGSKRFVAVSRRQLALHDGKPRRAESRTLLERIVPSHRTWRELARAAQEAGGNGGEVIDDPRNMQILGGAPAKPGETAVVMRVGRDQIGVASLKPQGARIRVEGKVQWLASPSREVPTLAGDNFDRAAQRAIGDQLQQVGLRLLRLQGAAEVDRHERVILFDAGTSRGRVLPGYAVRVREQGDGLLIGGLIGPSIGGG